MINDLQSISDPTDALTLDQLYTLAVRATHELLHNILVGTMSARSFGRLGVLLGALPLPYERYAWAAARLANSRQYALRNEYQAAAFEIRLLARRLAAEAQLMIEGPTKG